MIYWTTRLVDEDGMFTGELDTIKEDDLNFVPDGDGFQINMNGINYDSYISNPDKYYIDGCNLKVK